MVFSILILVSTASKVEIFSYFSRVLKPCKRTGLPIWLLCGQILLQALNEHGTPKPVKKCLVQRVFAAMTSSLHTQKKHNKMKGTKWKYLGSRNNFQERDSASICSCSRCIYRRSPFTHQMQLSTPLSKFHRLSLSIAPVRFLHISTSMNYIICLRACLCGHDPRSASPIPPVIPSIKCRRKTQEKQASAPLSINHKY